jgi:hypothetical protein
MAPTPCSYGTGGHCKLPLAPRNNGCDQSLPKGSLVARLLDLFRPVELVECSRIRDLVVEKQRDGSASTAKRYSDRENTAGTSWESGVRIASPATGGAEVEVGESWKSCGR